MIKCVESEESADENEEKKSLDKEQVLFIFTCKLIVVIVIENTGEMRISIRSLHCVWRFSGERLANLGVFFSLTPSASQGESSLKIFSSSGSAVLEEFMNKQTHILTYILLL